MAKKPRYIPQPGSLVEVSNRAVGSRFLLKPSKEANDLIAGVLARAARRTKMKVVFYVVPSSHFHLLLIVDSVQQLADFMEYLDSNLARELGRLYDWCQKFWSSPYKPVAVSDEPEAQIGRLKYLISNTIKEQLVAEVNQWPGLHAAKQILEGEPLVGTWVNRTYLYRQGRGGNKIDPEKARPTETLKLSRLPCWKDLSDEDYRAQIADLVDQVEAEARIEREATGKRVLGRKAILRQRAHYAPPIEKRSPIPLFHAASREARNRFREAFKAFLDAYRIASGRLREGHHDAVFPEGAFPPALPFVPCVRAGPATP